MRLKPFLLDHWLDEHRGPHIKYDLGSSTGPSWTVRELCALDGRSPDQVLADLPVVYSDGAGSEALRVEVARLHGVRPEDVQVTTGAAEALLILLMEAAEPGANVVVPFPCFTEIPAVAEGFGIEVRAYPLRREAGFRVDLDDVGRLVDRRTRLLVVNSPHNPTGAVLDQAQMDGLHQVASSAGVPLVSDEVYYPLAFGSTPATAAHFDDAIVLGDCSKAISLSGLRVGWLVDRNPRRRAEHFNTRAYFTISNSPLSEALAVIALRHRGRILDRTRAVVQANLERFRSFAERHPRHIEWVPPGGSTTAFPWLVGASDARPLCVALAKRGVLVVPGDCFEMPAHFRVGFGSPPEAFAAALDEMSSALAARL